MIYAHEGVLYNRSSGCVFKLSKRCPREALAIDREQNFCAISMFYTRLTLHHQKQSLSVLCFETALP